MIVCDLSWGFKGKDVVFESHWFVGLFLDHSSFKSKFSKFCKIFRALIWTQNSQKHEIS